MPITEATPFSIPHLAVYSGKSFYVGGQDARPEEMTFSADGLTMFMLGRQTGPAAVYQYTLTTPFDIGSGVSYSGNSFVVETQAPDPQGFEFSPDGLKMFVLDGLGTVYQYSLTTPFSLASGVTYSGTSLVVNTESTNAHDIAFSADGLKMFMTSAVPVRVFEYTLGSAFSLSGGSYSGNNFTPANINPTSIAFNSTGTRMFLTKGGSASFVYEYSLSSPFVITSGLTLERSVAYVFSQENSVNGMAISPDLTKLFVVGHGTDTVYQYTFV